MKAKVNGIEVGNPILTFSEKGTSRNAYLLGENSWKWRMESFVINQSYEKYDQFIDKIIQYLTTNSAKKSLLVEHESFYNSGETIEIFAQYFNKSYELDENANLSITLTNKNTKSTKNYNFSKANNGYQAFFDGLTPGNYTNVIMRSTWYGSGSSAHQVKDGGSDATGNYKTQMWFRPAGNVGGLNSNYWGRIEQDSVGLKILPGTYQDVTDTTAVAQFKAIKNTLPDILKSVEGEISKEFGQTIIDMYQAKIDKVKNQYEI